MTSTVRPPTASARSRRLRSFFLRSRAGRFFLLLVALKLIEPLGVLPSLLVSLTNLGLTVYALVFALWGLGRLRAKLLWRIRRKLIISYLLIGLVPTVLILLFFLLSAYFMAGQVSSFVLSTALDRVEITAATHAELAASDLAARMRGVSGPLPDQAIRQVLDRRLAGLRTLYPSAGAMAFDLSDDGGIRRRVATGEVSGLASGRASFPTWAGEGYRGLLRLGDEHLVTGISRPEERVPHRIMVVLRLGSVLATLEQDTGFQIDQVLTGLDNQSGGGVQVRTANPVDSVTLPTRTEDSWLSIPWLALMRTRSWTPQPESDEVEIVFVQFAFTPATFYQVITTNALQLGPDLGRAILVALGILAGLFLGIEVLAIFVGLMLARSITGSVHELSQGTEHIRHGDFTYKILVRSRDQLGELAESFNLMTTSIQDLLRQATEKERLEEELRIARQIQMSLLPKDHVDMPGLSIAALCLPATEVGGDYYDFIRIDERRLALLIADVSGKGTSAALYMAELKGLVLSLSKIYDSPRKLLIEANQILGAHLDSRSFITMAYAVIDVGNKTMTFARAGHNPILHLSMNGVRGTTRRTRVLAPEGLGLALDRSGRFEKILVEESVELRANDVFLFFTDGLSEAMNPHSDLFGESRLREILERYGELAPEELRERIFDEIFTFAEGEDQHDDMTMVLVKVL